MVSKKPHILVSSCFLGNKVRYDGAASEILHPQLSKWRLNGQLIAICPEMAGGLPVPRARAEKRGEKVIDENGRDVSTQFFSGAQQALLLCEKYHIRYALLKEFSPSCGSGQIYDGSFSGKKIAGMGTTAQLLTAHGVQVFSELTLGELILAVDA